MDRNVSNEVLKKMGTKMILVLKCERVEIFEIFAKRRLREHTLQAVMALGLIWHHGEQGELRQPYQYNFLKILKRRKNKNVV